MNLSNKLNEALNEQINREMYSSYLYFAMATHFTSVNLPGFAHWMKQQSEEEWSHAMKLYDYIFDRSGTVSLMAIQQPPGKFKSPLDIFKQVLEHEQKITRSITKLFEIAEKEKDYAAQIMLQWFISEQVEEEKNGCEIIAGLEMIGDSPAMLLMYDRRLAERK